VSWFEAIVLGIVQGLTEFLPISSTGHLRIVPAFAGWEDPGAAFTAIVQLGTTLAVLIYFRDDLWRIARSWWSSLRDPSVRGTVDARLGWYLIVATIPISIFGFAFDDQIETGARDLYLIGTVLIVFAFVMLIAERVGRRQRGDDDIGVRDAVLIAVLFAFIAGYASIAWLLRFLTSHGLEVFVGYRVVLGAVVLALTAAGTIS
jgi:undecaprenyl-diphosphatase